MRGVIVDERIDKGCQSGLLRRGFTPFLLPRADNLTEAISAHPDSVIFSHGSRIITTAGYCERAAWLFSDIREMFSAELHFSSEEFSPGFPGDAIMNSLVIGNKMFCNAKTVSKSILNFAKSENLEIIHTNQAYPKCATLVLNDEQVITADRGLAARFNEAKIEATLISPGGICLPPYEYGFIGGACGVYEGRVYFFGDYSTHPDAEIIEQALGRANLAPISLSDGVLRDFGGMLFLK